MSDDRTYDARLVKHHIRRNTLDPKVLQAHLDQLEDCADMGEPTVTRFQDGGSTTEEEEAPAAE